MSTNTESAAPALFPKSFTAEDISFLTNGPPDLIRFGRLLDKVPYNPLTAVFALNELYCHDHQRDIIPQALDVIRTSVEHHPSEGWVATSHWSAVPDSEAHSQDNTKILDREKQPIKARIVRGGHRWTVAKELVNRKHPNAKTEFKLDLLPLWFDHCHPLLIKGFIIQDNSPHALTPPHRGPVLGLARFAMETIALNHEAETDLITLFPSLVSLGLVPRNSANARPEQKAITRCLRHPTAFLALKKLVDHPALNKWTDDEICALLDFVADSMHGCEDALDQLMMKLYDEPYTTDQQEGGGEYYLTAYIEAKQPGLSQKAPVSLWLTSQDWLTSDPELPALVKKYEFLSSLPMYGHVFHLVPPAFAVGGAVHGWVQAFRAILSLVALILLGPEQAAISLCQAKKTGTSGTPTNYSDLKKHVENSLSLKGAAFFKGKNPDCDGTKDWKRLINNLITSMDFLALGNSVFPGLHNASGGRISDNAAFKYGAATWTEPAVTVLAKWTVDHIFGNQAWWKVLIETDFLPSGYTFPWASKVSIPHISPDATFTYTKKLLLVKKQEEQKGELAKRLVATAEETKELALKLMNLQADQSNTQSRLDALTAMNTPEEEAKYKAEYAAEEAQRAERNKAHKQRVAQAKADEERTKQEYVEQQKKLEEEHKKLDAAAKAAAEERQRAEMVQLERVSLTAHIQSTADKVTALELQKSQKDAQHHKLEGRFTKLAGTSVAEPELPKLPDSPPIAALASRIEPEIPVEVRINSLRTSLNEVINNTEDVELLDDLVQFIKRARSDSARGGSPPPKRPKSKQVVVDGPLRPRRTRGATLLDEIDQDILDSAS
ncbi:hypothetical protein GGX14DRAFT_400928 [Mycena pura]|uniref:Uncharacterized protein n=1 Tax=Mycena pura TaxID=153505 RepID=A0AAD6Y6Z5_9AGAR|nr:hypothetical protein GGX14DRAFT_400928 [Mycena pura]